MKTFSKLGLALLALVLITACSSKPKTDAPKEDGADVKIADVVSKVKEAYGDDYVPSMEIDEETLSTLYGITMDNVVEFFGEMPMMSTHVDSFVAIQAKEGKGADVAAEMKAYREQTVNSEAMYPMNVAKVQSSEVVVQGDYVFFVMLGAYNEDMDASEADALKFAQEQNKIGVDAINAFFN